MSRAETIAQGVTLYPGDCMAVLAEFGESCVDACVTDPPYHLTSGNVSTDWSSFKTPKGETNKSGRGHRRTGFMGKQWDGGEIAFEPETWAAVYRVLKPGGHLLAFGAPKNFGFMQVAMAKAGFEIRDVLCWVFGSGFPKSHNISKGIDREAGAEREIIGRKRFADGTSARQTQNLGGNVFADPESRDTNLFVTAPATEAARQWEGWGTALKPAYESIILAQKPFSNGALSATIGSQIAALESSLWSMLPASTAEKNFGLSRKEYDAACAFAQWNADERNNTRAALSEVMGTARFVLALTSSLSTVSSWKAIWAASSQPANTSIIETELNTTIDLRTLNYLLSKITPATIMQAHKSGLWSNANADIAERAFDATLRRLHGILEHSALANAIGQAAHSCQDAGVRPSLLPIIMARKPLVGTVAANVQEHGTGALNIDGCRVAIDPDADASQLRTMQRNQRIEDTNGQTWGLSKRGSDAPQVVRPDGRWPANVILSMAEDEYQLKPFTLPHEKRELFRWLSENA